MIDTTNQNLRRLLNLSTEFTFEGKTYKIAEATIAQQAEFSTWVEQRAWEAVERMGLNETEVSDKLAMKAYIAGEIAAGKYEWGGEYVIHAMKSMSGAKHLLYIMMRSTNQGITPEIASAVYEANLQEIALIIEKVQEDPKEYSEMDGSETGKA